MPKIKKVLCIGNSTVDTDNQCRRIAIEQTINYYGMVAADNITEHGCYHVSIADFSIKHIQTLINQVDEVIFLDQDATTGAGTGQILKNVTLQVDRSFTSINKSDILFVGCSHTYGIGHSSPNTVYPSIIANQLKLNPLVRGNPGLGNYLIEDVLSEYAVKEASVIIQFTDIFRLRYWDKKTKQIKHIGGHNFTRQEIEMFDEERLAYEFKQMVARIVGRLRDAGAKFLFFQLTHDVISMLELTLYMSEFKEYCWTPDIAVDLANDKLHHGPASHKLIADRLLTKWNELYAEN